jgi:phosphomannomutase
MHELGSVFGGEVSGHYYFADFYNADSGAVPALLLLQLLGSSGQTLSGLLEPYRTRYFISGEVNSEVADPLGKLAEIRERYADADQTELDGVSVEYADWHFNVRCSNTEPLMRLCLESLVSPAHMEQRRDEVLAVLRS